MDEGGIAGLREEVREHLAEGYALWEDVGLPPLEDSERYKVSDAALAAYQGENAANLAALCQCFWLFRKLHGSIEGNPIYATLLGDYFFTVFSKNLIPLDSVALNGEFARLLASDTRKPIGSNGFLEFIGRLPAVIIQDTG